MQIVIDIPEDDYQRICETKLPSYGAITYIIHRAFKYIKNGKPLPKGHGRLIDADRLTRAEIMHLWYHLPNGDIACPKVDIDHAPTVIEADKE